MVLPDLVIITASIGRGRDFIESKIRTTAGQSGVSGSDIKAIPLALPSLDEQRQIVSETGRQLSFVRRVEHEVDAGLKRAHVLRRAVLKSMLEFD